MSKRTPKTFNVTVHLISYHVYLLSCRRLVCQPSVMFFPLSLSGIQPPFPGQQLFGFRICRENQTFLTCRPGHLDVVFAARCYA